MTKPRRSLGDGVKRKLAAAAKAANARERNIAQQYLNAGPNITNLARAAYHWYNSVPGLGGQDERGNILITGEAPSPGMRNPKNIIKNGDDLYETFVKRGNFEAAKRMLDDKAKKIGNVVTDTKGDIQTLYRGDRKNYNVINEPSGSPIFTTTDKKYASNYASSMRTYDDKYGYTAYDLSDYKPENIKEFYGFGRIFNLAPSRRINTATVKEYFRTVDKLKNKLTQGDLKKLQKSVHDIYDKYVELPKEEYGRFKQAVKDYKTFGKILGKPSKELEDDVKYMIDTQNRIDENMFNRRDYDFFKYDEHKSHWKYSNKKHPYGYFRKNRDELDDSKVNDVIKNNYDVIRGHDTTIDAEGWYNSQGTEYAFKNPNQVKLREITYDDEGKLIPLSKRLNLNVDDNRYGLIPIIGVGAGYAAGRRYLDEQRPQQSYGGSIHIAPSKRGTFTAAATKHGMGVQEFAARVLRNKEDYSPSLVKKANFARNASKWNH